MATILVSKAAATTHRQILPVLKTAYPDIRATADTKTHRAYTSSIPPAGTYIPLFYYRKGELFFDVLV